MTRCQPIYRIDCSETLRLATTQQPNLAHALHAAVDEVAPAPAGRRPGCPRLQHRSAVGGRHGLFATTSPAANLVPSWHRDGPLPLGAWRVQECCDIPPEW